MLFFECGCGYEGEAVFNDEVNGCPECGKSVKELKIVFEKRSGKSD